MALQGVWAQEQFVREHPEHWGLGKLRQESMEGWIGLLKQYHRKHANMREGWVLRDIQYLDLYCIGAVFQNQVDFTAIECNHHFRKKLMYEPGITDTAEQVAESQLSTNAINILEEIESIKMGQIIPESIDNKLNGILVEYRNRMNTLRQSYKDLSEQEKRHAAVDMNKFDEEQKKCEHFTGKKIRRNRKDFWTFAQSALDSLESEQTPNVEVSDVEPTTTQIRYNTRYRKRMNNQSNNDDNDGDDNNARNYYTNTDSEQFDVAIQTQARGDSMSVTEDF